MSDAHKNFAYSTVLTAPSPAISGTSLVVQTATGVNYPAVPFNATVWPSGTQPTNANAEIVRVTAISTDTLTIVRSREGSAARTIIAGDQIAAGITAKTLTDVEGGVAGLFDYVVSGCVWSANSPGTTLVASMTAGVIWLNGVRLTVAAVVSRTFTASVDCYVGFNDNGDGTASIVYFNNTTNTNSPSLATGGYAMLNAIIVCGATSIAAATSVNQGQESMVLPIVSSVPMAVTDSNGNLICPRDPNRKLLGYRQLLTTPTFTTLAAMTGLTIPVIIPAGRKINIKVFCTRVYNTTATGEIKMAVYDGAVGGTLVGFGEISPAGLSQPNTINGDMTTTPTSTTKTYNIGASSSAGTAVFDGSGGQAIYCKITLDTG